MCLSSLGQHSLASIEHSQNCSGSPQVHLARDYHLRQSSRRVSVSFFPFSKARSARLLHGPQSRLRAEGEYANVQTEFKGLKTMRERMWHPTSYMILVLTKRGSIAAVDEDEAPVDRGEFFDVTVDTKSLLKFLGSYAVATTSIACE